MRRGGRTRWRSRRTPARAVDAVLDCLARRVPTGRPVALVVAHPDDEVIAAGASLHLLTNLLLVHVTDGAPRNLDDAARAGFDTPAAYADAREAELRDALRVAGCGAARAGLGVPDQDASLHMPAIAHDLARLFERHGTQVVITHAYEGGHPDHDAAALAVHAAAPGRVSGGVPGGIIEFPGYHAAPDGSLVTGLFLPGASATEVVLDTEDQARKRLMLDCFRTQAHMLASFGTGMESFRPARPDFRAPPHPGTLNYEHWGWSMTGPRWRTLAAAALAELEAPCAG